MLCIYTFDMKRESSLYDLVFIITSLHNYYRVLSLSLNRLQIFEHSLNSNFFFIKPNVILHFTFKNRVHGKKFVGIPLNLMFKYANLPDNIMNTYINCNLFNNIRVRGRLRLITLV